MFDIELQHITKTFGRSPEPAVDKLNLSVEKGSITTLLGPSGCGKTTTLRLIAGFEHPDEGAVKLAGKTVSDKYTWVPPEKRGIGMVFQDYALFPHLDVYHNIGFGYKKKDKNKRIKELLELVELQGLENRFPHQLSGGQKQRVALARALAQRPVVVLLDEPFSNLDAYMRAQVRLEVKRIIKETGTTAVMVSHDQKDALTVSDKVVVLKNGRLQQTGTPEEIYRQPASKFVANFVGKSNIISGRLSADQQKLLTCIGPVPYNKNLGKLDNLAGENLLLSIRPDSLIIDDKGNREGIIKQLGHTGETLDGVLETPSNNGRGPTKLFIHIHPGQKVSEGDTVRFRVLPEFVSVISENRGQQ